jgi:hypothetical protein
MLETKLQKVTASIAAVGLTLDQLIRNLGNKANFDFMMQTEFMPYVTQITNSVPFSVAEVGLAGLVALGINKTYELIKHKFNFRKTTINSILALTLLYAAFTLTGTTRHYGEESFKNFREKYGNVETMTAETLRQHTMYLINLADKNYKPSPNLTKKEQAMLFHEIAQDLIFDNYGVNITLPFNIKEPITSDILHRISLSKGVCVPLLNESNTFYGGDYPDYMLTHVQLHEMFHGLITTEEEAYVYTNLSLLRAYEKTKDPHYLYTFALFDLLHGLPTLYGPGFVMRHLKHKQDVKKYFSLERGNYANMLAFWLMGRDIDEAFSHESNLLDHPEDIIQLAPHQFSSNPIRNTVQGAQRASSYSIYNELKEEKIQKN